MDQGTAEFQAWIADSRDVIAVRRVYIDLTRDLAAGHLLAQIVYWFLPKKNGGAKLDLEREGKLWLARKREDWWEECRLTPRQFDRACEELVKLGVVEKRIWKHMGELKVHLWLDFQALFQAVSKITVSELTKPEFTKPLIGNCANGELEITDSVISSKEDKTGSKTVDDEGARAIRAEGTVVATPHQTPISASTGFSFDPEPAATAPPAPEFLPDGTRRFSDAERAVFEEACRRIRRVMPGDEERFQFRRIFMDGCTPELMRQAINDSLERKNPDEVATVSYFIPPARALMKRVTQFKQSQTEALQADTRSHAVNVGNTVPDAAEQARLAQAAAQRKVDQDRRIREARELLRRQIEGGIDSPLWGEIPKAARKRIIATTPSLAAAH